MALDVLVVEDDSVLRELLRIHLVREGYDVREAASGNEALEACGTRAPDVVVLDLSLPGVSGLEVCRLLRERFDPSPGVVIVTARASEGDIMVGFDAGADDYVVKPCRPREVVARVAAIARRLRGSREAEPLRRGRISIDRAGQVARVDASPLRLTPSELAILTELAREPGRVFSRLLLLKTVFASTHEGYARNVDCHVSRLRRKLERAGLCPSPVETVHGLGYRFAPEPA